MGAPPECDSWSRSIEKPPRCRVKGVPGSGACGERSVVRALVAGSIALADLVVLAQVGEAVETLVLIALLVVVITAGCGRDPHKHRNHDEPPVRAHVVFSCSLAGRRETVDIYT